MFKAHRLAYQSTLGSRAITKKTKKVPEHILTLVQRGSENLPDLYSPSVLKRIPGCSRPTPSITPLLCRSTLAGARTGVCTFSAASSKDSCGVSVWVTLVQRGSENLLDPPQLSIFGVLG